MTLEEVMAIAICDGFWETAETPQRWTTLPDMKREVFRICARRAIEAAKAYKAERMRAQA